jgi:hypothetical protein
MPGCIAGVAGGMTAAVGVMVIVSAMHDAPQ